jgi:uncharacterized membrane protein YkoI
MKKLVLSPLLVLLFIVCGMFSAAAAQSDKDKKSKQPQKYECKLISRNAAINQAKRKVEGKVVGVQFSDRGSRSVYRVRMLVDKKRVKTLSINACR